MKFTIYAREVRDYWNSKTTTQYLLAPEKGKKVDYMDTDILAVSMDDTEEAGEFRLRKGLTGKLCGEGTGAYLAVDGEYLTMRDILKGNARKYGRVVWF